MKLKICAMTTEAFLALCKEGNLFATATQARLGGGFFLRCNGENLFLEHTGIVSAH
jgi:hypothetical protein